MKLKKMINIKDEIWLNTIIIVCEDCEINSPKDRNYIKNEMLKINDEQTIITGHGFYKNLDSVIYKFERERRM